MVPPPTRASGLNWYNAQHGQLEKWIRNLAGICCWNLLIIVNEKTFGRHIISNLSSFLSRSQQQCGASRYALNRSWRLYHHRRPPGRAAQQFHVLVLRPRPVWWQWRLSEGHSRLDDAAAQKSQLPDALLRLPLQLHTRKYSIHIVHIYIYIYIFLSSL